MFSSGAGEAAELEKIIRTLEYENQEYVKQIEKEQQEIDALEKQVTDFHQESARLQEHSSQLDEDHRRYHATFTQSKDNIESIKKTTCVLSEHEDALKKQLDMLQKKGKMEEESNAGILRHYQDIWDDYKKKYESFPLAVCLSERKLELQRVQQRLQDAQAQKNGMEVLIMKYRKGTDFIPFTCNNKFITTIVEIKVQTEQYAKKFQEQSQQCKQIAHNMRLVKEQKERKAKELEEQIKRNNEMNYMAGNQVAASQHSVRPELNINEGQTQFNMMTPCQQLPELARSLCQEQPKPLPQYTPTALRFPPLLTIPSRTQQRQPGPTNNPTSVSIGSLTAQRQPIPTNNATSVSIGSLTAQRQPVPTNNATSVSIGSLTAQQQPVPTNNATSVSSGSLTTHQQPPPISPMIYPNIPLPLSRSNDANSYGQQPVSYMQAMRSGPTAVQRSVSTLLQPKPITSQPWAPVTPKLMSVSASTVHSISAPVPSGQAVCGMQASTGSTVPQTPPIMSVTTSGAERQAPASSATKTISSMQSPIVMNQDQYSVKPAGITTARLPESSVATSLQHSAARSTARSATKSPGRIMSKSPGRSLSTSPARNSSKSPGRNSSKSPGRAHMQATPTRPGHETYVTPDQSPARIQHDDTNSGNPITSPFDLEKQLARISMLTKSPGFTYSSRPMYQHDGAVTELPPTQSAAPASHQPSSMFCKASPESLLQVSSSGKPEGHMTSSQMLGIPNTMAAPSAGDQSAAMFSGFGDQGQKEAPRAATTSMFAGGGMFGFTDNHGSAGSMFGAGDTQASAGNMFGSPDIQGPAGNMCGAPSNQGSAGNMFGAPSNQGSVGNMFDMGNNQSSAGNMFGAPENLGPSGNMFGTPANLGSAGNMFASPDDQGSAGGMFGSADNTGFANSMFGTPDKQDDQPTAGAFAFSFGGSGGGDGSPSIGSKTSFNLF